MTVRRPIAVGSSIATVAVLETNADSRQVMAPNAMITRNVDLPTPRRLSTNIANRFARPCLSIAWARMNAPMKVKTVDDPKGASASSAGDDAEQDDRRDADEAADRDRHRLGDPQDDHARAAPPPASAGRGRCRAGRSSITIVTSGRQDQPDRAPALLEPLLARGELLLAEAAVGRSCRGMPCRRRSSASASAAWPCVAPHSEVRARGASRACDLRCRRPFHPHRDARFTSTPGRRGPVPRPNSAQRTASGRISR